MLDQQDESIEGVFHADCSGHGASLMKYMNMDIMFGGEQEFRGGSCIEIRHVNVIF